MISKHYILTKQSGGPDQWFPIPQLPVLPFQPKLFSNPPLYIKLSLSWEFLLWKKKIPLYEKIPGHGLEIPSLGATCFPFENHWFKQFYLHLIL